MKTLLARPPAYPDWSPEPEARRALDWFKTFTTPEEWEQRREAAARRLYAAALKQLDGPNDMQHKQIFDLKTLWRRHRFSNAPLQ